MLPSQYMMRTPICCHHLGSAIVNCLLPIQDMNLGHASCYGCGSKLPHRFYPQTIRYCHCKTNRQVDRAVREVRWQRHGQVEREVQFGNHILYFMNDESDDKCQYCVCMVLVQRIHAFRITKHERWTDLEIIEVKFYRYPRSDIDMP